MNSPAYIDTTGVLRVGKDEPPHVSSGDVWEALHRETGLAIVADAYTRLFERDRVTVERATLFQALCQAGDAMGVRWTKDGEFVLARSTSYIWDKLKEVPRRRLLRWQQDRRQQGTLPLEDLLEIAALSDHALDSVVIGKVIDHCWGIEEWGVVGNVGFRPGIQPKAVRPYARFLATLTPGQRSAAQGPQGLALETLLPAQQERLAQLLLKGGRSPQFLAGLRFRFDYVPSGHFVWRPVVSNYEEHQAASAWPLVFAATPEAALAAARRIQPEAGAGDIRRSPGALTVWFFPADGKRWHIGPPSVAVRTPR